MRVALHQPNYLPYLGYFHKMSQVDLFIFFDNVPMPQGKSWVSRNLVNLHGREFWLTVPTLKSGRSGQLIRDVEISWKEPWLRKHLGTLRQAYQGSPWLEETLSLVQEACARQPRYLIEVNNHIIKGLAGMLGINCQFAWASERVSSESHGTQMIIEVCRAFGCTTYLSGTGCLDFFRPDVFQETGMRLEFQHFEHPIYSHPTGKFIPNMSIVDAILCVGPAQVQEWL